MYVTLTELRKVALDTNGNPLPAGDDWVASQTQTSVGAFSACNADTEFVVVATDTDVRINGYNPSSNELLPAGSVVVFPAKGRTFTTVALP